jgi:hypothetical protein
MSHKVMLLSRKKKNFSHESKESPARGVGGYP